MHSRHHKPTKKPTKKPTFRPTSKPTQCRTKTASSVKHLIVIISENHSFDSYFGRYCLAPTYSNPTCNYGPHCCEAAPETVNGIPPLVLDDKQNYAFDPNHYMDQELCKQDNRKMDKYMTGQGCTSSDNRNFAVADAATMALYYSYAQNFAIADRFFQSAAGASSENDMYFARAKYVFLDNTEFPISKKATCYYYPKGQGVSYDDKMIGDVMNECGVTWSFYAEGYNGNFSSNQNCWPYYYDPTDNPFEYYASVVDNPLYFKDYKQFATDVDNGELPSVSYFKALGLRCEHPLVSSITGGEGFSSEIVTKIMSSDLYKDNTLIIMLPDESGGFYDHVTPPPDSTVDGKAYGPRTHFIAVGSMVKKNYISHVQMEPSSLIKFIEYNWMTTTGQLDGRDKVVNNIGDLLLPSANVPIN